MKWDRSSFASEFQQNRFYAITHKRLLNERSRALARSLASRHDSDVFACTVRHNIKLLYYEVKICMPAIYSFGNVPLMKSKQKWNKIFNNLYKFKLTARFTADMFSNVSCMGKARLTI